LIGVVLVEIAPVDAHDGLCGREVVLPPLRVVLLLPVAVGLSVLSLAIPDTRAAGRRRRLVEDLPLVLPQRRLVEAILGLPSIFFILTSTFCLIALTIVKCCRLLLHPGGI